MNEAMNYAPHDKDPERAPLNHSSQTTNKVPGKLAAADMKARLRARVPQKPLESGLAKLSEKEKAKVSVRQFLVDRGAPGAESGKAITALWKANISKYPYT